MDVGLLDAERFAGRDPELVGDEVPPGDELRDRVLDLQPRVHLHECRLAALVNKELAGARVHVADGRREGERRVAETPAEVAIDARRRALLEDLLVASLDRAVALAEVDAIPVGIEQDLDLDVAGALDEPLEDQALVPERRARFPPRRGDVVEEGGLVADDAHALAATASRRLDEDRKADPRARPWPGRRRPGRRRRTRPGPAHRAKPPVDGRRPCRPSPGSRPAVARPRPGRQPRTRSAKSAFSARNPKPGMDGVGAAGACRLDDGVGVEQVERARSVCLRCDRTDPEAIARALDAPGDLPAIRDEQRSGSP